jgi:hypothetical protein
MLFCNNKVSNPSESLVERNVFVFVCIHIWISCSYYNHCKMGAY